MLIEFILSQWKKPYLLFNRQVYFLLIQRPIQYLNLEIAFYQTSLIIIYNNFLFSIKIGIIIAIKGNPKIPQSRGLNAASTKKINTPIDRNR